MIEKSGRSPPKGGKEGKKEGRKEGEPRGVGKADHNTTQDFFFFFFLREVLEPWWI